MKLTFVDVKYKAVIMLPEEFLAMLPSKVALFLNIQFHHQYEQLKGQIEAKGVEVITVRPKHAWHDGQILGCSVEDWSSTGVEGFVYVGDGLFHPKALLFKNEQKVYIYDPKTAKAKVLGKKDIEQIEKARKGALGSFYASRSIGVIVTTKYGQTRMKPALKLQEKFPEKTFYYLLADVIDFAKLEDFPFIEVYVNTACPRIMDDNEKVPRPMVNIEDLGTVW
jgi:diphthamide biosynthesis enzyme Dph1/Dph2-like protein